MYRQMQEFYDHIFDNKEFWLYNFKAAEKDVYLLPVELRNFDIPSASIEGTGKGMGQSNIWYANSKWAQKEFVPDVLDYIRIMAEKCVQNIITPEQFNKKSMLHLSNYDLIDQAQSYISNGDYLNALQIYNLINSRTNTLQDSCYLKFQRANMLQNLLLYDESVELYKQFMYDHSQLDDKEKSAQNIGNVNLQEINCDCLWCLASTYMAMKQYFSACSIYQRYLEIEEDLEMKCWATCRLMYISNEEQDWQHLSEAIETYDKLNTNLISEEVDWYRKILLKKTGKTVKAPVIEAITLTDNPERDKMFPKEFTFKGVKFTRIDDDDEFKTPYDKAINAIWRKNLSSKNLKLVMAESWPRKFTQKGGRNKDKPSVLEESQNIVPIKHQILPFELDMEIVDCVLMSNAEIFCAHSIFTEYSSFTYLKDLNSRVKKYNYSFVLSKAEIEFYIADYIEAESSVDKYTGVINFTDKEAEATLTK